MRRLSSLALLALLFIGRSAAGADVAIKTRDGATLSATWALPDPLPAERLAAILQFDIDTDPAVMQQQAGAFAARGYAGVVANARGHLADPAAAAPFEHDAADTHAVLDWITRQPWSNGQVGMVGGGYSGFAAWAATKRRHPALKGIAVSAPWLPGQGKAMYNNVFIEEHAPANPHHQRWLAHPAYDKYWQSMVPYEKEFGRVSIPVLTITGYYDDAQLSALQYVQSHTAMARSPEHFVVIGPYDHAGAQARSKPSVLRGYTIDPVAQFDSQELKLQFMDYVLRGADRPELLKGKVNYQVMGANQWRQAPSLGAVHGVPMRLYFSAQQVEGHHSLANRPPATGAVSRLEVEFANREAMRNRHWHPETVVLPHLAKASGGVFLSEPFEAATALSGSFAGELQVIINKKDFDLGVVVYEAMPDGQMHHLAFALQRASFAEDPRRRRLLEPGTVQGVKFETTFVSRQMLAGSRLLVRVDADPHPSSPFNHGTGKDVRDDAAQDAGVPLSVEIQNGSYFEVPVDNTIVKKSAADQRDRVPAKDMSAVH